jgi:methylated-DNA-protein-cysteine methyltransferase-like protein
MPSSRPPRRRPSTPTRRSDARTARVIREHMSETYRRIHDVIVRIPRGKVMTYGDVAFAAGMPRAARVVGYALHTLAERVPWQRVVGRRSHHLAHVSIKDPVGGARQRQLLEKEGVRFGKSGSIDLETYGWGASPRAPRRRPPRK